MSALPAWSLNKDDGTGEAQAFCDVVGIPILAAIPADEDIRRKSANYEIIGTSESQWGSLFEQLGIAVAEARRSAQNPISRPTSWTVQRRSRRPWCHPRPRKLR